MFSDEPDPTLFTTLRQRHLRQNARRTAEKARGNKKSKKSKRRGPSHVLHPRDGGQLRTVPICSVTFVVDNCSYGWQIENRT